mmetsp:Transcript_522/g.622  ORF Transcript_522/g.622 Transcript_522/m.622 type:complete len:116 (+) Transcript_522:61-408(+)
MRHVAAYLLCVLGGKEKPCKDDVKAVITAAGGEADDAQLDKLIAELGSKNIDDVLKEGQEKLSALGPMSGGGSAGGAAKTADAAEPEPEEEEEEESEADLGGGGLFGGSDDDDDW